MVVYSPILNSLPELFSTEAFLGVELERMKSAPSGERGAIYTRQEVVAFILDLVGYTVDQALCGRRLLEPSFGSGDFLLAAVKRLLESVPARLRSVDLLKNAIRAVEVHRETFLATQTKVSDLLISEGLLKKDAEALAEAWLVNGDFLLENFPEGFDVVVGNPPYVRQEVIPAPLLAEYRQRYVTLYDRADLYVPFIEQSLRLLKPGGQVGFICSDRWMKNRYGGPLREMVSQGFSLKYYVDMVGTAAFQSEVVAYPAITVIEKSAPGPLRMAHRPEVSTEALNQLKQLMTGSPQHFNGKVIEMPSTTCGAQPWLLEADAQPSLALVRRLEAEFPTLEEAGCSVGIGVATGADRIFIGRMEDLDVEPERKLPLAMTRDLIDGQVKWRGLGVINPFEEDGSPASFSRYPRFAACMEKHAAALKARHCAQRGGTSSWYRTIDRITTSLARTPKLLIPDIKGGASIVLEPGELYPHHNLYFMLSREWPLAALQAVLMSGIAHLFVRAYSTKMHGGALRFQAQYLRRIRLPHWAGIPGRLRQNLLIAAEHNNLGEINKIVASIYQFSEADRHHLTQAK